MLAALDANWVIVFLTLALFAVAYREWRLNQAAQKHTITIERAYVDMSPAKGLPQIQSGEVPKVVIDISNYGHTPAEVIGVALIGLIGERLPDSFPDIQPKENARFFIQPGGDNTVVHWIPDYELLVKPLTNQEVDVLSIRTGYLKFWIIGWVDYTDRFGETHRHRFTRQYHPPKDVPAKPDETNYFIVPPNPGFNGEDYDKQQKQRHWWNPRSWFK